MEDLLYRGLTASHDQRYTPIDTEEDEDMK